MDYKSDTVTDNRTELVAIYETQVALYRRDWERLTGAPARAGLFFIHTGRPCGCRTGDGSPDKIAFHADVPPRSLRSLGSSTRRMRTAWDRRARQDARHFIECGRAGSEAGFWSSGRRDLEDLVLRGLQVSLGRGAGDRVRIGRLLKPLSERSLRRPGSTSRAR